MMQGDESITRRSALELAIASGGALALAGEVSPPASGAEATEKAAPTDWDWLVGRWKVRHRKLKDRLVGSTEWLTFGGSCVNWPLLGGHANVDDNVFNAPGGQYRGVGLRALDPATGQWAIWWLDSRFPDKLDVPVRGGFQDGVGIFLSDDVWNGTPVTVRFRWSDIQARSAVWDQAFSTDGGATWESNWVMHFTRE